MTNEGRLVMITIIAALVSIIGVANSARAAEPYMAVDVFMWEVDRSISTTSVESTGLRLRAGYRFSRYFSIEGHWAGGGEGYGQDFWETGADSPELLSNDYDVHHSFTSAVFAKPTLPLHERFALYGVVGGAVSRFDGYNFRETSASVSYGAGAEVGITQNVFVSADYIVYQDHDEYTFSATSIGGGVRW